MNTPSNTIEEQIAERLQRYLAQVPRLGPVSVRQATLIAGIRIDIDAVVNIGDLQYEILVEVKSDGSPSVMRQAAGQLRSLRRSLPDDANIYLAIGAPYISKEGMDVCKEEGVGCVDAAGNCFLSFGGVYIDIEGNRNPQPLRKTVKSLFSPKSSRVIRAFLLDAQRWWQVQEIAGETGISIGLVSRLKRKLLDEEFIVEQGRKLRIRSPKRLIDAWVENYRYNRNTPKEYYSLDDASTAERRIADYCNQGKIPYALGLFSAASRVAPHVRMNKAFVFVDTDPHDVAQALSLKPVPSGSNVVLLKPYDAGVFYKSRDIDSLMVVSDVQIYIDLKTYKGRGEEAADFLMRDSLESSWRQGQNTANAR